MQISVEVTHHHVETLFVFSFLQVSSVEHAEITPLKKLFCGCCHAFQEIGIEALLVGFQNELNHHHLCQDVLNPSSQNDGHENFQLEVIPSLKMVCLFPILQTFQEIPSRLEMVCPFPVLQTFQEENQIDYLELNFHF
uniref:Uncharacterized protein n=1 Tax=Arundo donax TaxID=35708 RepID=A0A0A9G9D2_ARUDO